MKKSILLILLLGFVSFACILQSFASEAKTQGPRVKYILISSKDLSHVNAMLRKSIETLLPDAHQTYFEYNSAEAKKYIEELDIKFVPFVIYDNSIAATDTFFHMAQHKMINKLKDYYVIPGDQLKMGEVMFLGRKKQRDKLYMFAMGLCQYAKEAEGRLINFIRKNKLKIDIKIRYLVNMDEFGITSTHGPEEIKENLRQIAIQKYYPDKFLDYLLLVQDKGTEEALGELDISLEEIDARREEALKMLNRDFKESKNLGIKRSPTFLWENIYLIPNLDLLEKHSPFNIKKVRKNLSKKVSGGPVEIKFFYSDSCRACRKIKENFLPEIVSEYKDKIVITYHNIADAEEFKLRLALENEYGILKGGIPEVFLPTVALVGGDAMRKDLAGAIDEILEQEERVTISKIASDKNPILEKFSSFSPAVVTAAGLVDGINPCAFASMIFFVSFLGLNSYRKNRIACIGGAFILGVFLTYLALGFGIFQVFKKLQAFSSFFRAFYYAIAFFALALGINGLYGYIQYRRTGQRKGCDLRLYNRLRSIADNRRGFLVLVILALVNGFIIALLESACTGQVYFPTIAFVMKIANLRLHAFLYLILYNIAFILPLIIIFFLAYKGLTSEKIAIFTNRHFGRIKIATTVLFFGLAILLLAIY